MELTIKEIKNLAEFAGLTVLDIDQDEAETEITVEPCGKEGLRDGKLDKPRFYAHIAWFTEYPEEGAAGLGPEIPDPYNVPLSRKR